MDKITLEVHICDQQRSYQVVFEGPQAEVMAMLFIDARKSTHVVSEIISFEEHWVCAPHGGDEFYRQDVIAKDQPYEINWGKYPRLYAMLYPTCEHGLSRSNCYGPGHDARPEEIAQGW